VVSGDWGMGVLGFIGVWGLGVGDRAGSLTSRQRSADDKGNLPRTIPYSSASLLDINLYLTPTLSAPTQEEEEDELPLLASAPMVTPDALRRLGVQFAAALAAAPTHPRAAPAAVGGGGGGPLGFAAGLAERTAAALGMRGEG